MVRISAFVPFTFMRRNNLLMGGTPRTEYPATTQLQLELTKNVVYTFGGKAFFGEKEVTEKPLHQMKAGKASE